MGEFSIDKYKGEYVERFLKERENVINRNTWESYAEIARNHVIPNLGKITLDKISAQHISRYKRKMLMTGRKDGKKGGLDPITVNISIFPLSALSLMMLLLLKTG